VKPQNSIKSTSGDCELPCNKIDDSILRPIFEVEEEESRIQNEPSTDQRTPSSEKELPRTAKLLPSQDTIDPGPPPDRFPCPDLAFGFGFQTDRFPEVPKEQISFPEVSKEQISILDKSSPRLVKKSTVRTRHPDRSFISKQSRAGMFTMHNTLPLNSDSQTSSTTRNLFPENSTERHESVLCDPTADPYSRSRLGSNDQPIRKSALKNPCRSRSPGINSVHDSPRKVSYGIDEYLENTISKGIIDESTSPRELSKMNDDLRDPHVHLYMQGEDTSTGQTMFRKDTFAYRPGERSNEISPSREKTPRMYVSPPPMQNNITNINLSFSQISNTGNNTLIQNGNGNTNVSRRLNFLSGAPSGGGTSRSGRIKGNPGFHMMTKMNTNIERSIPEIPRANTTDPDNNPNSHPVVLDNRSSENPSQKILNKKTAGRKSRKVKAQRKIEVNPAPNSLTHKNLPKPAIKLQKSKTHFEDVTDLQKSVTIHDPITDNLQNPTTKSPELPEGGFEPDYRPPNAPTKKDFVRNKNNFKSQTMGHKGNKLLESDYLDTEQDEPKPDPSL
jgi:hypothetical protein